MNPLMLFHICEPSRSVVAGGAIQVITGFGRISCTVETLGFNAILLTLHGVYVIGLGAPSMSNDLSLLIPPPHVISLALSFPED